MKKQLLTIISSTLICFISNGQNKIYDFAFDNSYSASVGTGTFSNNTGTSFVNDRNGNTQSALNIANSGSIATLIGLPYGSSARSVSVWVKLNTLNPSYNFIYNYGALTGATNPFEGAYINGGTTNYFSPNISVSQSNTSSTWYHFVFTYDGSTVKIYRDAVLVGSNPSTAKNTISNSDLFRLGLTESGGINYFDGSIDDLKIYDYALDTTAISNLFNFNSEDLPNNLSKIYDFPFNNDRSSVVGVGAFDSNYGTFVADRNSNPNSAINIPNTGTFASLVGLPYGSAARTVAFWAKLNTINPNYNFLYVYGNNTAFDGAYITNAAAYHFTPVYGQAITHSANTWYHFVFTYSNGQSKMYRDGALMNSSFGVKSTQNNNDLFTLGLSEGGFNYFDGAFDDLKIYNFAISPSQVTELYTTNEIVLTGIKENHNTFNLKVYPNPVQNYITLDFENINQFPLTINIQNQLGEVCKTLTANSNKCQIDISTLNNGLYFIQAKNETYTTSIKFIKQ